MKRQCCAKIAEQDYAKLHITRDAAGKKKLQTAISMQLFGGFFSNFGGQDFFFKFYKNIFASALKRYIV